MSKSQPARVFSPQELTHLARFGKAGGDLAQYGEVPVEYITGKVEFCGRVFAVTPEVMIPRVETEELVELALAEVKRFARARSDQAVAIAEVGTGSGAVAISLALELAKIEIPFSLVAGEVSASALAVARENCQHLLPPELQAHVHLAESDLLAQFPRRTFQLLLANLPYIPSQRINYLDESVKDYEPHVALDGGGDGMQLIKKCLRQAETVTATGSVVLLEVDYTHTQDEFAEFNQTWDITEIEDTFHRQRFIRLEKR